MSRASIARVMTVPGDILELLPTAAVVVTPLTASGGPWSLQYAGRHTILRRYPPDRYPPELSVPHVNWLHAFLRTLGPTGFPAPLPADDLAGDSLAVAGGAIWELLTYLPGRMLGWCRRDSLWQTGDIITRFHAASERVDGGHQRPDALPLSQCRPTTSSVQGIVRQVHHQLEAFSYPTARRCVIHGDPTSHNVLVGGRPSRAVGLIDFTLAYREAAAADLAFALWRSARPRQEALHYDLGRITSLVLGYHRVRPLRSEEIALISTHMLGRGLQMLARMEARGQSDQRLLARLEWVFVHQDEIRQAVEDALRPNSGADAIGR